MIPDNVTAVIRSAHERTEALCVHLVQEEIRSDRVVVIHERPFTAALRRAYQIGIDAASDWTLCIDADVLIRQGAVLELLQYVNSLPDNTLGGAGRVFYKFRGGADQGGLHLYRTALLRQALHCIPDPKNGWQLEAGADRQMPVNLAELSHSPVLRPESYVKWKMQEQGHDWVILEKTLGLHDFEQYYADIFRKLLVRVQKSPQQGQALLQRALAYSRTDPDFLVATWGIRVGLQLSERIELDAKQWESEATALLLANNLQEKQELGIEGGAALVERIYMDQSLQRRDYLQWLGNRHTTGPGGFYLRIRQVGWFITRLGLRMQRVGMNRIRDGAKVKRI